MTGRRAANQPAFCHGDTPCMTDVAHSIIAVMRCSDRRAAIRRWDVSVAAAVLDAL
jgi:hypothetical protein